MRSKVVEYPPVKCVLFGWTRYQGQQW